MLDELEALIEAQTVEDVWQRLVGFADGHGFDRLLYGFTRFRTAQSWGDLQDFLVLSNYSPDYLSEYLDMGYYRNGPMLRWVSGNTGSCSWQWAEDLSRDGGLTPDEERVLAFNHAHGLKVGYAISFHETSSRAKGALGLAAAPGRSQDEVDEYWRVNGQKITVFANIAHMKISCLPHKSARRALTNRQREVLEWVGEGKTALDIATIMGLTPATVEKHLRLARDAL
ncbi:LuxR family transcriptional regulator, partial [Actibacterium sp.]|uniref:LuxR family transcriptional regulator n=1 Tax=Actibacterium sp. TaxID=1872125 RepID=UPI0035612A79